MTLRNFQRRLWRVLTAAGCWFAKTSSASRRLSRDDDPDNNFLVYIPCDKPSDTENWLLDILTYSEEYYADTVALIMRRLNLVNTDLRRVVERIQVL